MTIRPVACTDEDAIWEIFHAVVGRGDTYTFDPQIQRDEALAYWLHSGTHAYVAENEGQVEDTYILKSIAAAFGISIAGGVHDVVGGFLGLGCGADDPAFCVF